MRGAHRAAGDGEEGRKEGSRCVHTGGQGAQVWGLPAQQLPGWGQGEAKAMSGSLDGTSTASQEGRGWLVTGARTLYLHGDAGRSDEEQGIPVPDVDLQRLRSQVAEKPALLTRLQEPGAHCVPQLQARGPCGGGPGSLESWSHLPSLHAQTVSALVMMTDFCCRRGDGGHTHASGTP